MRNTSVHRCRVMGSRSMRAEICAPGSVPTRTFGDASGGLPAVTVCCMCVSCFLHRRHSFVCMLAGMRVMGRTLLAHGPRLQAHALTRLFRRDSTSCVC